MRLYLKAAGFCIVFACLWRLSDGVSRDEAQSAWFTARCYLHWLGGGTDGDAGTELLVQDRLQWLAAREGWTEETINRAQSLAAELRARGNMEEGASDAAKNPDDEYACPTTAPVGCPDTARSAPDVG